MEQTSEIKNPKQYIILHQIAGYLKASVENMHFLDIELHKVNLRFYSNADYQLTSYQQTIIELSKITENNIELNIDFYFLNQFSDEHGLEKEFVRKLWKNKKINKDKIWRCRPCPASKQASLCATAEISNLNCKEDPGKIGDFIILVIKNYQKWDKSNITKKARKQIESIIQETGKKFRFTYS